MTDLQKQFEAETGLKIELGMPMVKLMEYYKQKANWLEIRCKAQELAYKVSEEERKRLMAENWALAMHIEELENPSVEDCIDIARAIRQLYNLLGAYAGKERKVVEELKTWCKREKK